MKLLYIVLQILAASNSPTETAIQTAARLEEIREEAVEK